jgi:cobaltochelatase CobT
MSTADVKPGNNRRPAGKAEAANEPFKQALASCTRALARQPELEIAFSADKPSLMTSAEGAKARLPEPPRKPNPREAALSLTRWSRRGSKPLARAACKGWR